MVVRGAPLIGATAAWSIYLAALEKSGDSNQRAFIKSAAGEIAASRPTAVNLRWAVERMLRCVGDLNDREDPVPALRTEAQAICDEDVQISRGIGEHGLSIIEKIAAEKNGKTVLVGDD